MSYESMKHSAHPHKIVLEEERTIFKCNGCHELGLNWNYKCTDQTSRCNFHLHTACAEAAHLDYCTITPAIYQGRHTFHFLKHPVDNHRYCVACGRHITGYNYHCDQENLDLHPGCSREFPPEISVGNVRFQLRERLYGRCQHCDRSSYEGGSEYLNVWAYVSYCGTKQYFAGCVRDALERRHTGAQGPNEYANDHRVHYNQVGGGRPPVVDVVVPAVDVVVSAALELFNQFVRAFAAAFMAIPY